MNLKDRLETADVQGDEKVKLFEDMIDAINDLRAKFTAHIAGTHSAPDTTNTLEGDDVAGLESR